MKQMKLILAWIEIHREELYIAWKELNENGKIIKINGLE